jgi:hypothetical protein
MSAAGQAGAAAMSPGGAAPGRGVPQGTSPPTWENSPPSGSGAPSVGGGRSGGGSGEPDPLARLAVPPLIADQRPAVKKTQPTPPVSRLIGNRDFIVVVACSADRATVNPGGAEFRWPSQGSPATDLSLARHVQQLIQNRQRTVRPGDPPYRPLIRFHVAPDGLRTYYRAYPPLEPLGVSMTRENLEE